MRLHRVLQRVPSAASSAKGAAVGPSAAACPRVHMLLDIDGTLAMTDHLYMLTFRELLQPFG